MPGYPFLWHFFIGSVSVLEMLLTVRKNIVYFRPWDMFRFMYYQCKESGIEMPAWSCRWINIRKAYCNFYHCARGGIETMLKTLGNSSSVIILMGMHTSGNKCLIQCFMLVWKSCIVCQERQ